MSWKVPLATYVSASPGWYIIERTSGYLPNDPITEKYWTQPIVAWGVNPDYAWPISIENINKKHCILAPDGRVYDAEIEYWDSIEQWLETAENKT